MLLTGCASTHSPAPIRERPHPAEKPARPAAALPPGQYRVLPGDTLYKIAFEHGLDTFELAAWNHLGDPDRIRSGDLLRLRLPVVQVATHPLPAAAVVREIVPARPSPARTPVAVAPAPQPATDYEAAPQTWSWPVHGQVLARFGEGLNKGIDIAGPRGTPVQAAASGRVVYAGSGLRGYGKLIIIRHGKTLLSAYAHNARILVSEGQNVTLGQAVGEIGDSDADRVKLHFEIRERGLPVDPMNYLLNAG